MKVSVGGDSLPERRSSGLAVGGEGEGAGFFFMMKFPLASCRSSGVRMHHTHVT